jgi:hypothetical protein
MNKTKHDLISSMVSAKFLNINTALIKASLLTLCFICLHDFKAYALNAEDRRSMGMTLTESVNRLREAADLGSPDSGIITREKHQKVIKLLNEGITLSHSVSDEFLDWLCPSLKQAYREHCIKGSMTYLEGLKSQDIAKQYAGIKQTNLWINFYENYGPTIGDRLNSFCR